MSTHTALPAGDAQAETPLLLKLAAAVLIVAAVFLSCLLGIYTGPAGFLASLARQRGDAGADAEGRRGAQPCRVGSPADSLTCWRICSRERAGMSH